MASFRKRGDKWEYRIRYKDVYTGKYKEITHGGYRKRSDAVTAAANVTDDLAEGRTTNDDNPLFVEYMQRWFQGAKNAFEFNTQKSKLQSMHRIEEHFKKIRLKSIDYATVQRFLNSETRLSHTTIENDFLVIHAVIRQAYREKYFKYDPLDDIKIPKGRPKKKARFWTIEQFNIYYNYQNGVVQKLREKNDTSDDYFQALRLLVAITTLACSGARIGELCALNVDDYNQSEKILYLHHNFVLVPVKKANGEMGQMHKRREHMKTSSSNRDVPLPEQAYKLLDFWLIERLRFMARHPNRTNIDRDALFNSRVGTRIDSASFQKALVQTCKNSQLPIINPHALRHTYASFLVASDVHPKKAQILLGHKRIETTLNIYTHLTKQDKFEAVDRLNDLLNTKMTAPKKISNLDSNPEKKS